jgi:hypothetical protein
MRPGTLATSILLASCAHPRVPPSANVHPPPPIPAAVPAATPAPVDFARDVRPILESRCRPCHFPGGRMYERLPFDRAETLHTLGTRLFTRIETEDEQALIRRFLNQTP